MQTQLESYYLASLQFWQSLDCIILGIQLLFQHRKPLDISELYRTENKKLIFLLKKKLVLWSNSYLKIAIFLLLKTWVHSRIIILNQQLSSDSLNNIWKFRKGIQYTEKSEWKYIQLKCWLSIMFGPDILVIFETSEGTHYVGEVFKRLNWQFIVCM